MPQILLCNQTINPETLQNQCAIDIDQIFAHRRQRPRVLFANTPYLIDRDCSDFDHNILGQLSFHYPIANELTHLSLSYGSDNVIALAEISERLREYNVGLMGAATSAYANRMDGFAGAVKEYQAALMNYRQAVLNKS